MSTFSWQCQNLAKIFLSINDNYDQMKFGAQTTSTKASNEALKLASQPLKLRARRF